MNVLRDTGTVMIRELRPMSRDPFAILFGMLQPLVFLGLYGPLLPEVTGGSPWPSAPGSGSSGSSSSR